MLDQSTLDNAGLMVPLTVKILQKLIDLGWPIDKPAPITPETLVHELQRVTR
jgi:hypothetical protein